MKKPTGINTFEIYLAAVSFYSRTVSQFSRTLLITRNTECVGLQAEPNLATSPEDMIVVSFVCGTQMIVYRICMRPHITFKMDKYTEDATRLDTEESTHNPNSLSYNQFEIQLKGFNEYSVQLFSQEKMKVNLEFKGPQHRYITSFYMFTLLSIVALAMILIFICSDKEKNHEDKINNRAKAKSSQASSHERRKEIDETASRLSVRTLGTVNDGRLDLQRLNFEEKKINRFNEQDFKSSQVSLGTAQTENQSEETQQVLYRISEYQRVKQPQTFYKSSRKHF